MNVVEAPAVLSPQWRTPRLALGAVVLGALLIGMPPAPGPTAAQAAIPPGAAVAATTPGGPGADAAATPGTARKEAAPGSDGFKARITIDADDRAPRAAAAAGEDSRASIVIEKNGRKVQVLGIDGDAEYDSFSDLVNRAPWLAALVFFSVALVFFVPLLLVLALIGYKMRKHRMLNETMLKLAEKGVVPPAEALDAIAGGSLRAATAGNLLYERAREVRKRTAWSDLRKGIVMGAIGLALAFYSVLDDGSPNGLGLVLLFVGIGYVVLWWLEERNAAPAQRGPDDPPPTNP